MNTPNEILDLASAAGEKKINLGLANKLVLGIIAGALIGLGYLANLRITASIPKDYSSLANILGGFIFPVGLILLLLAGGELATGNMMAVGTAMFTKKVTVMQYVVNILTITVANIAGAIFAAYFLGHLVGLFSDGIYLERLAAITSSRVDPTMLQKFLSGIGCNWFVGLAVWLNFGAKDASGKIWAIWFPVMTFVAIGFQHSIANAFMLPAAVFEGLIGWSDVVANFIPVWLGNVVGGTIMVAGLYAFSLSKNRKVKIN